MVLSALFSAFLIAKQAAGIAGILLFHLFSELDYSCSGFSFLVKHRKPMFIYLELRPLLCTFICCNSLMFLQMQRNPLFFFFFIWVTDWFC